MTQNFQNFSPKLSAQAQSEDADVIDLGALLAALWRGKWLIILVAAIAVLIGGYFAFFVATPLYRSTAVVILETREESIVNLDSVLGGLSGDTSVVNSEVEVLKSRGLMGKVVQRLDLTNDPEFNTALQTPKLSSRIKGGLSSRIKGLLRLSQPAAALPSEDVAKRTTDSTIDTLLGKVSIRNVPASLVFQITVESEDAQKAARIADTIVDVYILNQLEVKFEATEQATSWLSDRVAELQVELEASEAKVKDFNADADLISVEALQGLERQLKELRDRVNSAAITEENARQRVAVLKAATSRSAQAEVANDAQLDRLIARADTDPTTAQAFDTRFAQIEIRAELEASRALSQLRALRTSQAELEAQIERQSQDLITLQQLTREAEASRILYEYFLARLKETSAQQGIQQADSRILSNAVVPRNPSAPRESLILAISGMLGLMLGSGTVLLREARNNSFRSSRELEQHTGYTVMGQIPLIPARNRKSVLSYLAEKPTSAAAEAVRNLRTSVLLSNVDTPPKVILVTSSLPGEGKTNNSMALAQNLVGMGKKVLLIEGDLRRRAFGEYFEGVPERGLISVLSGEATLEDVLHHDSRLGADLLVGERTTTNAADLFSSESFRSFIRDMSARYDFLIIDTPPVLIVPDARVIAQVADAILFTVKWDSTSKQQVEEALHMFESVNQKVTGLILNQIDPKGMKRYGYGGKYGSYAAYGAKYYRN